MKMSEACAGVSAYEKVTRSKLEDLDRRFDKHEEVQVETFKEFRDEIRGALMEMRKEVGKMSKDIERRLPAWVTVVFTLGGGLVGALLTVVLRAALKG
jgi:hypothetical protein